MLGASDQLIVFAWKKVSQIKLFKHRHKCMNGLKGQPRAPHGDSSNRFDDFSWWNVFHIRVLIFRDLGEWFCVTMISKLLWLALTVQFLFFFNKLECAVWLRCNYSQFLPICVCVRAWVFVCVAVYGPCLHAFFHSPLSSLSDDILSCYTVTWCHGPGDSFSRFNCTLLCDTRVSDHCISAAGAAEGRRVDSDKNLMS